MLHSHVRLQPHCSIGTKAASRGRHASTCASSVIGPLSDASGPSSVRSLDLSQGAGQSCRLGSWGVSNGQVFGELSDSSRILLQGISASPQSYELLRSLLRFAHAVHGGPLATSRAGWQAPMVSNAAAAAADPQLHRCRQLLVFSISQGLCNSARLGQCCWPTVHYVCCHCRV